MEGTLYIQCPKRKGNPRISILVCKACGEECKEKKKLPRIQVAKKESKRRIYGNGIVGSKEKT